MRRNIMICSLTIMLFIVSCSASKKLTKTGYDFPETMGISLQQEFTTTCDKGQILYNLSCAKCHNVTVNRKELIPDFTQDQLSNYDIRLMNPDHGGTTVQERVSPEELSSIVIFLTYKKKNNPIIPAGPGKQI